MKQTKQNESSILNDSVLQKLQKSSSAFSIFPSQSSRLSVRNEEIIKKLQKLNSISQSVDVSAITKNPLNMIEYEMQGQKSRHDPQMVLAKLRRLQNRAQLHRVSNVIVNQFQQMNALEQQKLNKSFKTKRFASHRDQNSGIKKQTKLNYLKIYQSYLKQKQIEREHRQRYEEDEIQVRADDEDLSQTKNGVKYFNSLKKHPRILDLTMSKKLAKQGITQRQMETQRKSSISKAVKQNIEMKDYEEEKIIEKQKQAKLHFQNPEQIIQRQITKFYLKKNPGSLSPEAQKNQRSLNLIKTQKQISFQIDENKISSDDKKRLRNKFNELANQLARSDRRNSLQGILPKLKQSQAMKKINLKNDPTRKLFN